MTLTSEKYKNLLSKDEISEIVQNKLGKEAFKINRYNIKPVSENPMGFLGEHVLITVDTNEKKEVTFFLKKMPSAEVPLHLKYAEETKAFYKEVELYKTLFEDLKKAQNLLDERWHPEFYYAKGTELLVLEDLRPLGYKMLPERTLLDEEHVVVALKSIAKMHAASIIFEEKFYRKEVGTKSEKYIPKNNQKREIGEIYPHLIFETEASDIKGHIGNTFCEAGAKSEVILIDLLEGYTKAEIEVIKKKLPDEMRKMMKMVKPSEKYKNVFLHGDLWSNNLMFRYNEKGQVDHAIIIDYQLARYGPPAHDLIMFFHLTQSRSFRQKHQDKLMKYYYEVFSNELRQYDLNSSELYPWDTFKESCDSYHEFGCITSVYYFQLILLSPNIIGKFLSSPELFHQTFLIDRSEMIKESFLTDDLVRERTTEALHELISCYILNKV